MTSVSLPQLASAFPEQTPAALGERPFVSYAYSYPHKTAYRPLDPPVPLRHAWADEPKDALFLYLHVPFCEMRCGFCNLFTTANPRQEMVAAYLAALRRQAFRVRAAIGSARYARMAIGGGTPTYLDVAGLSALFDIAENLFDGPLGTVPLSVETSPRTAQPDKIRLLRDRGVMRISMGVQSFIESEVAHAQRAQSNALVARAIETIRAAGVPVLNLDLIYGLEGQTVASWLASLRAALAYRPEELYLYPLYVRPLTGLGRHARPQEGEDLRLACYRAGRDLLLAEGYEQVSMRMFRRRGQEASPGPVYCCQDDGMVGLGCGARSYTRALHYSSEYAVSGSGVKEILHAYLSRDDAAFDVADYGCRLDAEEQRRRYVIKSILRSEGLDTTAYRERFGSSPTDDLPQLRELLDRGYLAAAHGRLTPTPAGLEVSDAIGPWLYSNAVRRSMGDFDLR